MRTLIHILNKILTGCCCIILAIMVFRVTWQVIIRFIFNASGTVFDEFTQILSMWMTLLGGVYVAGLKKHLAIDLSVRRLPTVPALALDSLIQIIITIFAIILMIHGGNTVVEKAQHVGQISPVLKWSMDKVHWVTPVSESILVWCSVMNIINNYRKRSSHQRGKCGI